MTACLPPLPAEVMVRLRERLAGLGETSDSSTELTRLYLGPAHRTAIERLEGWMQAAGMRPWLDPLATLRGRYEGATPGAPALVLGSHVDTVRNAGRYDGTLGVLLALAAVELLQTAGRRLPFAVEIAAFGDEEGVRFPTTLGGSRALAHRFDPACLHEEDDDGITRAEALRRFGCEPARWREAALPSNTLGYLEVHIEQGPVLEAAGQPVGAVTAINGATRGTITIEGASGHAGTTPMAMRADALAAAAELVLAVEAIGRNASDLTATVGLLNLSHAAANTIPGWARLSYDLRSPSDSSRRAGLAALDAAVAAIGQRRDVRLVAERQHEAAAAPCDERFRRCLQAAASACGMAELPQLPSGAGHDAMAFQGVLPFAMMFVRCRGGLSHTPEEHCTEDDMMIALACLHEWLLTIGRAS